MQRKRIQVYADEQTKRRIELAAAQQQAAELTAPTLLAFEVSSTLRRLVHLREISSEHGERAFAQFQRLPIHLSSRRAVYPIAWRMSADFGLARTYDTSYLALARLL